MSPRYVCIHGHFYQPPRENPWLEAVEKQESARPYHDWNHRVTAECYGPNAASRILNDDGRIRQIMNNYARISFNIGPTLLSWLEEHEGDVYDAVIEADARSQRRFGGHGSAMAQAYNHLIMPLANRRDRRTQIRWGIRDFEHRFGRTPRGMWLPETAVDLETLDLMAGAGLGFTVLAPHQAETIRPPGDEEWRSVEDEATHTGRPYRVELPSGRDFSVFFYHGPLARGVAFERLLTDGARFKERILEAFDGLQDDVPLVHLATDGETYGHHHTHGEMGLSYALSALTERDDVELVNYAEYLDRHPPTWEARVRESSSWSCAHGVERWRSDCGCHITGQPGWTQAWRQPLREALDILRDRLEPVFEEAAGEIFDDPWQARDEYVEVVLDRSAAGVADFLDRTAVDGFEDRPRPLAGQDEPPSSEGVTRALRLMELQRHLMLMYTSCGWFFDDISGIEAVQVLRYAGRVLHLAEELFPGLELEEDFLSKLEEARSNVPEAGDGRRIFRKQVESSRIDLSKAAAHYAVSSVFDHHDDDEEIYCYHFRRRREERHESGRATLIMGQVDVASTVTRNVGRLSYGVLHLGEHDVTGGVRAWRDESAYQELVDEVTTPFKRTDYTKVIRVLDQEFAASTYSLRSLFRDAQLRIVDTMLESSVEETESAFAEIYEDRAGLLRLLADLEVPAPEPFRVAGEYVVNTRLKRILGQPRPPMAAVQAALDEADGADLELESAEVAFHARLALEREVDDLRTRRPDAGEVARVRRLVEVLDGSPLDVELWDAQNAYWRLLEAVGLYRAEEMVPEDEPHLGPRPRAGEAEPPSSEASRASWLEEIRALGEALHIAVPATDPDAEGLGTEESTREESATEEPAAKGTAGS